MNRQQSADRLCSLSSERLFERYGITRVADLTGLDTVGVPVWSAIRPLGHFISVTGGKSLDPHLARATAIAESIEIATMEVPDNEPSLVRYLLSGKQKEIHPDLVWMNHYKAESQFNRTSTGQALGCTIQDAILHGLYECVERDQITLRMRIEQEYNLLPPKVDLSRANDRVKELIYRCDESGISVFVFAAALDIQILIYVAALVDRNGTFFETLGYGTDVVPAVAIEKAILEAIQSRAIYISGARDDMTRGRFARALNRDQKAVYRDLERAVINHFPDWDMSPVSDSVAMEEVIWRMGKWAEGIMVKVIEGEWPCAKVIVEDFETPITVRWKANERRYELLKRNLRWTDSLRATDRKAA